MAEALSTLKKSTRKNRQDLPSRGLLQYGTPMDHTNSNRLSLMSNARHQKINCSSLERLSILSEKEDSEDLDNYFFDYGNYLLRKAQSRILAQSKEQKEENIQMCFVSLKFEFEGLLDKFIALSSETQYFKMFFEIIRECSQKIEEGKQILQFLKDNDYEDLITSLSQSLDHTVNKLQLIDIDKSSIEELFNKNIWGSGSELEEYLKKINGVINKNKDEISNIATELVEINRLYLENSLLKQRFCSVFEKISNDYLQTNYKHLTNIVKTAFKKRQECNEISNLDLSEFLQAVLKPKNEQLSLQFSKFDSSYPLEPNSASTPQPNEL